MKGLSPRGRDFFRKCGRRGGRIRARRLAPARRSAIAARAAGVRWDREALALMQSVRLDRSLLEDPVYLEELLQEGSLSDWRTVYRELADRPFGPTARALQQVLASTHTYGVTPLWQGILRTVQGAVS